MQGSANPFGPEEISLLKGVFDEAVAALPTRLRTSAVKALIAERVLKHAANGERDRVRLLTSGLLDLQNDRDIFDRNRGDAGRLKTIGVAYFFISYKEMVGQRMAHTIFGTLHHH